MKHLLLKMITKMGGGSSSKDNFLNCDSEELLLMIGQK